MFGKEAPRMDFCFGVAAYESPCCASCTSPFAIPALSERAFHLLELDSLFGVLTGKADRYLANLLPKGQV